MKRLFVFAFIDNDSFLKYHINSLKSILFPNIDEKYLIILSHKKYSFKINSNVYNVQIPKLQHNISEISKFQYIEFALNHLDIHYMNDDLVLVLNENMCCLNRPLSIWDELYDIICNNDFVFSPYINQPTTLEENFDMCNKYNEKDKIFAGYYEVKMDSLNLNTNIIFSNIKSILMLKNDILELLNKDIKDNNHFPLFNEKTYINKIVNENEDKYNIYVDYLYGKLENLDKQIEEYQSIIYYEKD